MRHLLTTLVIIGSVTVGLLLMAANPWKPTNALPKENTPESLTQPKADQRQRPLRPQLWQQPRQLAEFQRVDDLQPPQLQQRRQFRGNGKRQGLARVIQELNLTQEQATKLYPVLRAHRQQMRPLRRQLRMVRRSLRKELQGPTPDQNAVSALLAKLTALRNQRHVSMQALLSKTQAILTPVQQAKLTMALQSRRRFRGRRRRGNFRNNRNMQQRFGPRRDVEGRQFRPRRRMMPRSQQLPPERDE